jgi:glutamyl-tRNA synthetase
MPKFAHLPLILKPDGNGKLSKRDGDRLGFPVFPLEWKDPSSGEISSGYRERGYEPEAVVNMLALLGWHTSDNREIFSMEELIQLFSLEKISKNGHDGPYSSFNGFKKEQEGRHIDYIFVKNGVRVSQHATHSETWGNRYPTDHFPVSAVIELP